MIDFHNHVLPGVDDGADTLQTAGAALAAFVAQGVETVVTTPHYRASLAAEPGELDRYLARIDAAWDALGELAAREFPGVRLERGVEVNLDTPTVDLSEPKLRLAGTSFALVEFPHMAVPPNAANALFEIKLQGRTPVLAHPERYMNVTADLSGPAEWVRVGALLQVNAGSLIGKYGPEAESLSWRMVERGMVAYVCSDHHARGTPHSAAARARLIDRVGEERAALLTRGNGERLLQGRSPLAVPPVERKRSLWSRLTGGR